MFQLAIDAGLWWGLGLAFVGVAAGFYYYFKTVRAMYWRSGDSETPIKLAPITKYALGTCTIATVVLGIYPMPILWLLGASCAAGDRRFTIRSPFQPSRIIHQSKAVSAPLRGLATALQIPGAWSAVAREERT